MLSNKIKEYFERKLKTEGTAQGCVWGRCSSAIANLKELLHDGDLSMDVSIFHEGATVSAWPQQIACQILALLLKKPINLY